MHHVVRQFFGISRDPKEKNYGDLLSLKKLSTTLLFHFENKIIKFLSENDHDAFRKRHLLKIFCRHPPKNEEKLAS